MSGNESLWRSNMAKLKQISWPNLEDDLAPEALTEVTMKERKAKILNRMKTAGVECLIIYADLEHGSNFEYLVGFLPRFEEALLVLHATGEAYLILGNENLNKASKARIKNIPIHMPFFSLPNQPMNDRTVEEILGQSGIDNAKTIGIVGWKNFTSPVMENSKLFDTPNYLISAIQTIAPDAELTNETRLFIGDNGARTTMNANEFAHYEFGAALAGNCILDAMKEIRVGCSEMEIAENLSAYGQPHNVVTIMASGERFVGANIYPSNKKIQLGDTISMTTGFKGGLESRGAFAIAAADELPIGQKDYLEKIVYPYFDTVCHWLDSIHIGILGAELYQEIEAVFPSETYGWHLNPGHLCADEEWMSSPIYPGSLEKIRSGMLFQIDIIPSVPLYNGVSAESGIFLADEKLRKEIEEQYPDLWHRLKKRRKYMAEVLGIKLKEEILPTSAATAFCNPFLLDKSSAIVNA